MKPPGSHQGRARSAVSLWSGERNYVEMNNCSVTAECVIQKALQIAFLGGRPIQNMKAAEVQKLPSQEVVRVKKKKKKPKFHGM